jgi:hypothetical protein
LRHSVPHCAKARNQSGGLEVPSSNLGAPIGGTRWKRRVFRWPLATMRNARVYKIGVCVYTALYAYAE